MPKLVVQIPAYNEEATIARVIQSVPRQLAGLERTFILILDDGSSDQTAQRAKEAGADLVISHPQNIGLGKNFKKGTELALQLGADILVNLDGDGQFEAKEIESLIQPIINQEAEVVIGSRFLDNNTTNRIPLLKRWGNRFFTKLINIITGEKLTDAQCGFRAYSKEALLRMNLFGRFTYTQEVLIDLIEKDLSIQERAITVNYFAGRRSYISGNLVTYGLRSLALIANATRDTKPLSFFGLPGLIIFGLGMIGGLCSLIYWLLYLATSPVKTLLIVSIFLVTFGTLLIIFGLLADMIKRHKKIEEEILYQIKKRS